MESVAYGAGWRPFDTKCSKPLKVPLKHLISQPFFLMWCTLKRATGRRRTWLASRPYQRSYLEKMKGSVQIGIKLGEAHRGLTPGNFLSFVFLQMKELEIRSKSSHIHSCRSQMVCITPHVHGLLFHDYTAHVSNKWDDCGCLRAA